MKEIKFDKIFVLDDDEHLVGLQEYQNFEQDDGSIKAEKVNAIMVIEAQGDKLTYLDPDGVERSYWLNRIGLLSDKEFQAETVQLKLKDDRKKLYELLRQEYGS